MNHMRIIVKTPDEIAIIKENGKIIGGVFALVKELLQPGIDTLSLDLSIERYIRSCGAVPSVKGYEGFPASSCISINEETIHGIPSKNKIVQEGDLVGVDVAVFKNGFHVDSAYSFMVGKVSPEVQKLVQVSKEALFLGIEKARVKYTPFDIANNIQTHVEKNGFHIIRDFIGHGLGKQLHEAPPVPNYRQSGMSKIRFRVGTVIAIEPMVSMKSPEVYITSDKWTVKTKDGLPSAHFEHTVAITEEGPEILSVWPEE